MISTNVLVNGLPGAGKTTLARALSQALGLPLFSKDTIKETHADVLGSEPPSGWTQRRWNAALGAAANDTMWTLLADAPAGDRTVLEIYCDVPIETARRRFEQRHHPRHPIHGELPTDAEWEHWRTSARPLHIGPLLRVDTSHPADTDAVIAWVHEQHRPAHSETPTMRQGRRVGA